MNPGSLARDPINQKVTLPLIVNDSILGWLVHHSVPHGVTVDVKVVGEEDPEFPRDFGHVSDHQLPQENVLRIHCIVGLNLDAENGMTGAAPAHQSLGHVLRLYLPAISQPAEISIYPYPCLQLMP
ncbi:Uncharacterised protein [uncultured archaeon]|nr:Uncharacterised protein [uncultured archaeon]